MMSEPVGFRLASALSSSSQLMLIIRIGNASVYCGDVSKHKQSAAILGAGQAFGEMASSLTT